MKRWLLIMALGLLPGCDVATAALIIGSQDSDDDDPLTAPPGFDQPVFKAWTTNLANSNKADEQHTALVVGEGEPSTTVWTLVGDSTATAIFDPSADPNTINAILIQVSSTQNYELDCVEILDATNNVVLETASGSTWSNLVTDPDRITGPPDGMIAVTTASGSTKAFIFTMYNGPIPRFRINGHAPGAPAPGDILAVGGYSSGVNERPGGLAVRSDGMIHVTLSVSDVGRLVQFNLAGALQDEVEMAADLATVGSHSVALDPDGVIFTSASITNGSIQILRFETDLTLSGSIGPSSGLGSDRVEHNSIALDGSGNVIVVGGFSSPISGRNHWRIKLDDMLSSTPIWQSSTALDGSATDTYWHAVTTGENDQVFATGNLFDGALLGGTNLVYSSRFNASGVATWSDDYSDGDVPTDVGHAIALDAGGNIYVAGSVGTDADALDPVLLRYNSAGNPTAAADFTAAGSGNDEILDVAIDQTDGSIYVVGYETVAGQGENAWIRKYTYNSTFNTFTAVWERTHHGSGTGNDRAISCAISGNTLVVVGYETQSGLTKLVLRMYAK